MRIIFLIRELRKQMGMTRKQLAELSGVSHAEIERIEANNGVYPRFDTVYKLANALHVDIQDVFIVIEKQGKE